MAQTDKQKKAAEAKKVAEVEAEEAKVKAEATEAKAKEEAEAAVKAREELKAELRAEIAEEAKTVDSGKETFEMVKDGTVFNKGGKYIRTYSPKAHGSKFKELAKQFISKKGREGYYVK